MEKIALGFVGILSLLFVATILGPLIGGLAGCVVGLFWTAPILDFLRRFGVDVAGLSCWQIGVALGFMGGFFKATQTNNAK
jgi:hypothetical protein